MRLKVEFKPLSPKVDEGRRQNSDHAEDERRMKLSGAVALDSECCKAASGGDCCIGGRIGFVGLSADCILVNVDVALLLGGVSLHSDMISCWAAQLALQPSRLTPMALTERPSSATQRSRLRHR
jgi:hypothetical protein